MPEPLQAVRRRVIPIEVSLRLLACFPEGGTGGVVLLRTTTRARFRVAFDPPSTFDADIYLVQRLN
jgi:hypothetical protein